MEVVKAMIAHLGLGSSLGDRIRHLTDAAKRLETLGPGLRVRKTSPVYESAHQGLDPDDASRYPAHLNCVLEVETTLSPFDLLDRAHAVEDAGGRDRSVRWAPRTIDVDILLYGEDQIQTADLTIPHARMSERAFVLLPLADIAPLSRLPAGGTVRDLVCASRLRDDQITRVQGYAVLL